MDWDRFKTYLLIDRKMSVKAHNLYTLHSRYNKLSLYFKDIPFTRDNFNLFIGSLSEKGLSNSSLNNLIKMAKLIGKYLKSQEFEDYTYFKERAKDYEVLSPIEVESIIDIEITYSKESRKMNFRNRTIILLLFLRGLRIMEALDLKWADLHETPWGMTGILRDTKNHDDAEVMIPERVAKMIRLLPKKSDLVFDLRARSIVNLDLQKRAELAGVTKKVWCHLLRHSFATHLLVDKEVDGYLVSKLMRHKDPKSTQRYNHLDLKNQANILQAHDSVSDEQTIESVAPGLKSYVEKFVSHKRFVKVIEENAGELVIRIKTVYN